MPDRKLAPVEILLVEDSPTDTMLIEQALSSVDFAHNLNIVSNAEDALSFIYQQNHYRDAPRPHLILLDINLPVRNGFEVLSEIKTNPTTSDIPIIVLSSSNQESDINKAYSCYANSYIIKPIQFSKFKEIIATLKVYWLNTASLPTI